MKQLSELLSELEKILIDLKSPILSKLQQGLEYSEVIHLLNKKGITSNELAVLYNWRNGIYDNLMNQAIENLELFPDGIMLSLQDALASYELYTGTLHIWEKGLFPIFTNGGGEYLVLDINSADRGMILLYAPNLLLSVFPQTIYDSLDNLFQTVVDCFRKKAYSYNHEGIIDVDYDLKYELAAINNPKSEYWNDYR